MRILVCGSRNWKDKHMIWKVLDSYPPDTVIIEGECKGADITARRVAILQGKPVVPFHADWESGLKAGPERNERMLREGKPDIWIAFHENYGESKGTKHMVGLLKEAGVPGVLLDAEGGRTIFLPDGSFQW